MAPWIVPAGLHTSGRTAISTTPAAGSIDTISASSRSGRVIRFAAEKRAATSPGDTIGFGGSRGLAGDVGEADGADGHLGAALVDDLEEAVGRPPPLPQDRARRGDLPRRRHRAHPEREVGGEGPRIGIGVEGDARDHVDGEGDHAGAQHAVVQQLLAAARAR